jgi:WD40 repeat protein
MGAQPSKGDGSMPFLKMFEGHRDSITVLKVTDKYLFTASRDTTVRAWSLKVCTKLESVMTRLLVLTVSIVQPGKKGECVREFRGHTFWIECMEVVDKYLFTGSADNTIRAWNTKVR